MVRRRVDASIPATATAGKTGTSSNSAQFVGRARHGVGQRSPTTLGAAAWVAWTSSMATTGPADVWIDDHDCEPVGRLHVERLRPTAGARTTRPGQARQTRPQSCSGAPPRHLLTQTPSARAHRGGEREHNNGSGNGSNNGNPTAMVSAFNGSGSNNGTAATTTAATTIAAEETSRAS